MALSIKVRRLLADLRDVVLAQHDAAWADGVDHCGSCGAENEPHEEDRCPECGLEGTTISTWGADQADRYRTRDRYDDLNAAGRWDIDCDTEVADLVRRVSEIL